MTQKVSPNEGVIEVFLPMAFRKIGGRKLIMVPEGATPYEPAPKRIDNVMVKALARGHRWRRMLESGRYGSLADIAESENVNKSFVSRTIRLAFLAPDIVEAILAGIHPRSLQLADLEAPFPLAWPDQRRLFGIVCDPRRRSMP